MVVLARGKSGGEVEPNPSRTAKSVHTPVTIVAGKVRTTNTYQGLLLHYIGPCWFR
jgi:hypothetical protein